MLPRHDAVPGVITLVFICNLTAGVIVQRAKMEVEMKDKMEHAQEDLHELEETMEHKVWCWPYLQPQC